MSPAADKLDDAGCRVVEEWSDDGGWGEAGEAIGVTPDGRWAFASYSTDGTCPHCQTYEDDELEWCVDEADARKRAATLRGTR